MKKIKSILSVVLLLSIATTSILAQTNSKVIAVINEADWCPACKQNGERAMKALNDNNTNNNFTFIKNDLTNSDSKKKSNLELKKQGLLDAMKNYKSTAVVYFFNPVTKQLISKIGISKSNKDIASAMVLAQKGTKVVSSEVGGCN